MNVLTKHWQIARAALDHEKQAGRRIFNVDEAAYLPAALEIVETPVSPTGRVTAWVLMIGLAVAILWLFVGKLDIVSSAPGRLIPAENVKLVQPATDGIVRAILVEDGQHVRAGQALVELDSTLSSADAEEARKGLETARLSAARDRAVISALDGKGLVFVAPPETPPDVAETSRALAQSQYEQIQATSAQHVADKQAAVAALAEAHAQIAKLDQTAPLLSEEVAAYDKLLGKQFVPKVRVLEIHREQLGALRDRDAAAATAKRAQAQIAVSQSEGNVDRAKARASLLDDLVRNEAEARERSQELIKTRQRTGMHSLTAPVDGTVTQLVIHTIGGVVPAEKPVMVIVPSGGRLIAEVKVLNRDAGFVHVGQAVSLKLDAFPFTRYGTIPGRVVSVSSDAVADQKLGLVYVARIMLLQSDIDRDGKRIALIPGMSATADIRTGRRSVASYLVEPVLKRTSEAARER